MTRTTDSLCDGLTRLSGCEDNPTFQIPLGRTGKACGVHEKKMGGEARYECRKVASTTEKKAVMLLGYIQFYGA